MSDAARGPAPTPAREFPSAPQRRPTSPRPSTAVARTALVAPLLALGLMGVLHLYRGYSPVHDVLSSYALTPATAGFFTAAVLTMAVAVAALGACAMSQLPGSKRALGALFGLSVGAFAATALFPTDPGAPHTPSGFVHRYAAGTAFTALAAAGWLLARRLSQIPAWSATGRRLRRWAALVWCGLGVFALSHVPVLWPGSAAADALAWFPERGLVQRLLLCAEIALLLVVARPLRRLSPAARVATTPVVPPRAQPHRETLAPGAPQVNPTTAPAGTGAP